MTLLVIADDPLVERQVPRSPADVLLSCGDLAEETILSIAEKCNCREVLAVKGNHDSSKPFRTSIRDLHTKQFEFRGLRFGGFHGCWKYKPTGHFLFDQDEVVQRLHDFPAVDVFLAHNSPRLVHDRDDEVHAGFIAFNQYIARARPKLFLHGHQHKNEETVIGPTRVIGTYGYRFVTLPE